MDLNKIYVGDTLETLRTFPDDCIDIVVTSPPYNKGGAQGGLVKEVNYQASSDIQDENKYQANQIDVLNELYRVVKPKGHVFYNHKVRWVDGVMIHPLEWLFATKWLGKLRQEIVWDRGIAGQLRGWRFWQVEERIYWMQKGIMRGEELLSKHAKLTSIWRIRPEQIHKEHPAPFPLDIPTRCIYSVADKQEGLTVLDPYCGIGTTLVAARFLKHNYVGIDCSDEYAKIAEDRMINNHSEWEKSLIALEMTNHWVKTTYQERKQKKKKV